jgi:hypothetical protein
LHDLVQNAPQMLPLAGSPRLTVLGREVRLGSGYADLLAVGSTGRLVIIEVKLAGNAESRRAVVAQVLSYAGYLQGLDPEQLESQILSRHMEPGGSVLAAVRAGDQQHAVDAEDFRDGLARSLPEGSFRLVIVLDSAPDELVQVVGYLQSVTDKIDIDLVTVAADDAGLVSIYCDNGSASMQFWRSVFERRAPRSIPAVEAALGTELEQGNATRQFAEPLLQALTQAYREAVSNHRAI